MYYHSEEYRNQICCNHSRSLSRGWIGEAPYFILNLNAFLGNDNQADHSDMISKAEGPRKINIFLIASSNLARRRRAKKWGVF